MFDAVLEKYPDAVGESGVPLQPLAQLKLLELAALTTNQITAKPLVSPDSLCSNAVWQPALQTPYFLSAILEQVKTPRAKADAQKWQHLWEDHERSRHLFAACDLRFAGRRAAIPPVPEGEGQGEREQTAGPYAATDSPSPLLKGRGPGRGVPSFAAVQGRHAGTKLGNVSPGNLAPPLFWFTTLGSWRTTNLQTVVPSLAVEIENPNWLALRIENSSTSRWFLCRAESEVASRLTELAEAGRHIPDYFGLGFEVAQKKLAYQAPVLRLWSEVSFSG